jgi:hypothetical protein
MPAALTCPGCQRPLRLPETRLGQTVRCPLCWEEFLAEREQAQFVEEPPPGPAAGHADEPALPVLPATGPADDLPVPPAADAVSPIVPPGPRRARPVRFPAFLSKDPDRLLKGLWDAELTEDGLRLTRPRNPEVWVSVGHGTAQYLGGNQLTVRVRGRDVTLTIIRDGTDQVRLAADVAAFLNNERDPLDPDAYRVRRALYAAALAPLGAPVLALALRVYTRTGLGVAGWLCLGLGSALLALALLRRGAWSVRQRLIASAVPAALAFAAVGIAYAAGGTPPPPVEPGQWRTVTVRFADDTPPFQVRMPGTPQPAVEFYGWWGDLSVVNLPKNRLDFAAGALQLSPEDRDRPDHAVIDEKKALFLKAVPGVTRPVVEESISQPGYPGRQFTFRVDGPRFKGVLVVRLFMVNRESRKLYFLAVAGPDLDPRGKDVSDFFDSFEELGGAGPPPQPQPPPRPEGGVQALDGLVEHWSFDANRSSNGTYRGGARSDDGGVRGRCLRVFGGSQFFDMDHEEVPTGFRAGQPFTFVGWVRTNRAEATVLSLRSSASADPWIDLVLVGGRLRLAVHDDANASNAAVFTAERQVSDGAWHQFAFTRTNDGQVRLYVDGQFAGGDVGLKVVGGISVNVWALGRRAVNHERRGERSADAVAGFEGWIDEVALFDHDLTANEIQRLARRP